VLRLLFIGRKKPASGIRRRRVSNGVMDRFEVISGAMLETRHRRIRRRKAKTKTANSAIRSESAPDSNTWFGREPTPHDAASSRKKIHFPQHKREETGYIFFSE